MGRKSDAVDPMILERAAAEKALEVRTMDRQSDTADPMILALATASKAGAFMCTIPDGTPEYDAAEKAFHIASSAIASAPIISVSGAAAALHYVLNSGCDPLVGGMLKIMRSLAVFLESAAQREAVPPGRAQAAIPDKTKIEYELSKIKHAEGAAFLVASDVADGCPEEPAAMAAYAIADALEGIYARLYKLIFNFDVDGAREPDKAKAA